MYNKSEIDGFRQKDKRISWLSIFSTIVNEKDTTGDIMEKAQLANELNSILYKEYPFPKEDIVDKSGWKVEQENTEECPECGSPMKYKEGAKDGKVWRGYFCTKGGKFGKCKAKPIWLPSNPPSKMKAESSILEEMQSIQNDLPPEFGGQ